MKVTRIAAHHYRTFADPIDVKLPLGGTAVLGPNGSGKSSLVNAIPLALFGTRSWGELVTKGADESEPLSLTIEFEHGGAAYRVRRGYSPRGRGKPSLDFERYEGDVYYPLTRESIKETEALISQTLGFDRATYLASAFLAQGSRESFTDPALDARHRKDLLCDLLSLDTYDALLERVRYRATTIRDTTTRLSIQVEEAERELAKQYDVDQAVKHHRSLLSGSELKVSEAESTHKTATEKLIASREVAAKLTAAREVLALRERELREATNRRETIQHNLEVAADLPKLKAESQALAGQRESIERDLAAARAGEKAREEHRRLTVERNRILSEATGLVERAGQLREQAEGLLGAREGESQRCELCEQVLGFEAATTSATKLHAQADELAATALGKDQVARTDYEPLIEAAAAKMADGPNAAKQAELENALRLANEAERTLATIDEKLKRVEELKVELAGIAAGLPPLVKARDEAEIYLKSISAEVPTEDLEAAVARAYGNLVEARGDAEQSRHKLAVAEAELKRLTEIEERTKDNRRALATHQAELAILTDAERLYGKNGLPAYVLENRAIPLLEAKANEALGRLGGKTASARIELRTQREKKDGAGQIEALDIVVLTPEGYEQEFSLWSGGEQMRIEIALRLGLLALSGAEMGILILDEPGNLDASGKADLIALLDSVVTLGIDRVILVSHDSDLREAFDQVIEIEIGPSGMSRVVGSEAPAEVVAA